MILTDEQILDNLEVPFDLRARVVKRWTADGRMEALRCVARAQHAADMEALPTVEQMAKALYEQDWGHPWEEVRTKRREPWMRQAQMLDRLIRGGQGADKT